jgi:hypothetical protein
MSRAKKNEGNFSLNKDNRISISCLDIMHIYERNYTCSYDNSPEKRNAHGASAAV